MTTVAGISPDDARELLDLARQLKRSGLLTEKGKKRPGNIRGVRPIHVRNVSGEIIPRFACMQAVGIHMVAGECFIDVNKPRDVEARQGPYLFNQFEEIQTDNNPPDVVPFGQAAAGPHVNALFDNTAGEPVGTRLVPQVDSWFLAKGCGPFVLIGENSAAQLGGNVQRVMVTENYVAQQIDVKLKDACILYATAGGTGYFGTTDHPEWPVDFCIVPAEATDIGAGNYSIPFVNPHKLDAIKEAIVRLRRKIDTVGGNVTWELVHVGRDDQIARWSEWTYTGGTPILNRTWEGANPETDCPATLTLSIPDCLKNGDKVIACYHPEGHTYEALTSSIIGDHNPVVSMSFTDCTLSYTRHCDAIGQPPASTSLPTTTISAVTGFDLNGSQACIYHVDVTVPFCGSGSGGYTCVDICDALCYCEEFYSLPEVCEDPPLPPCTCIDCNFGVGVTLLSMTCPNGKNYSSSNLAPQQSDPCTWTVIFEETCEEGGCVHCEGDVVRIENMAGGGDDGMEGFDFLQDEPSFSTGDCRWSVPIILTEFANGDPLQVVSSVRTSATVTYDGSVWDVQISNTIVYNANPSFTVDDATCAGGSCTICNDNQAASFDTVREACSDCQWTADVTYGGSGNWTVTVSDGCAACGDGATGSGTGDCSGAAISGQLTGNILTDGRACDVGGGGGGECQGTECAECDPLSEFTVTSLTVTNNDGTRNGSLLNVFSRNGCDVVIGIRIVDNLGAFIEDQTSTVSIAGGVIGVAGVFNAPAPAPNPCDGLATADFFEPEWVGGSGSIRVTAVPCEGGGGGGASAGAMLLSDKNEPITPVTTMRRSGPGRSPQVRRPPKRIEHVEQASDIGTRFVAKHPELFKAKGCRACRTDVERRMNRWTRGKVEDVDVKSIARLIYNRKPETPVERIEQMIREASREV